MSHRLFAGLGALSLILLCHSAFGQDTRGTLLGRVTDPTGALISGAEVRARNVETGVTAVASTNEAGNFRIPYLMTGAYSVPVEIKGFRQFIRDGVEVRIGDTVELAIAMQLGSTSESVEVPVETPQLSTAESSLGQVVDQRPTVDLPNLGGAR
jgi:hypothetical protein